MTRSMEAHLRQLMARALDETLVEFDRELEAVHPLPSQARRVTFRITTPHDGARAFVLEAALLEVDAESADVTPGFDKRG